MPLNYATDLSNAAAPGEIVVDATVAGRLDDEWSLEPMDDLVDISGGGLEGGHGQGIGEDPQREAGLAAYGLAGVVQQVEHAAKGIVATDETGGPDSGQPHVGVGILKEVTQGILPNFRSTKGRPPRIASGFDADSTRTTWAP